jgi:outer membrane protein
MMALYNQSGITIAKNNLSLSLQQMEQIQAKLNAGSLTAKDLADAQSQKASSQYNLIVAQNTFAQQVLTLKQLLELEPDVAFTIDTTTELPTVFQELPSKQEIYNTALANMPEIKAAQMQIDINNTTLVLSRVGYRPTLSMSGRLYTGYTNTRNMEFSQQLNSNFNQQLGLNLSIPIFDRRVTWSRVGNAKINIKRAEITYTTGQKDLYRKIETAWLNANSKQSEAQAAQVQNEAAQLAYSLTKQQFDLGLVNPTDLQISQNTLLSAQQRYVQAKFQYALYISLVQFYQGSLLNK